MPENQNPYGNPNPNRNPYVDNMPKVGSPYGANPAPMTWDEAESGGFHKAPTEPETTVKAEELVDMLAALRQRLRGFTEDPHGSPVAFLSTEQWQQLRDAVRNQPNIVEALTPGKPEVSKPVAFLALGMTLMAPVAALAAVQRFRREPNFEHGAGAVTGLVSCAFLTASIVDGVRKGLKR